MLIKDKMKADREGEGSELNFCCFFGCMLINPSTLFCSGRWKRNRSEGWSGVREGREGGREKCIKEEVRAKNIWRGEGGKK